MVGSAAIKQGRSANSKGTFIIFFGQYINYSTGIEKPGKYIGLSCCFFIQWSQTTKMITFNYVYYFVNFR